MDIDAKWQTITAIDKIINVQQSALLQYIVSLSNSYIRHNTVLLFMPFNILIPASAIVFFRRFNDEILIIMV